MNELELKRKAIRESFEHDLRTVCRLTNPHSILEYGPGRSTEIFLEELPYCSIHSIEHNLKWYNIYKEKFKDFKNVHIHYKEISMKGGKSEGYVGFPLMLKEKFDLIFIDGRSRCDCLALASTFPNRPFVVLHDAKRANYQKYFQLFGDHRYYADRNTAILSNRFLNFIDANKLVWIDPMEVNDTMYLLIHLLKNAVIFYYIRFGDAEIYTMNDPLFKNKRHQPKDDKLHHELIEAFNIHDSKFLRSFTVEGWAESKLRNLRRIIGKYIPFDTTIQVPHVSAVHLSFLYTLDVFNKFIKIFQSKKVLLLGGPTVCNSDSVAQVFNVSGCICFSDTNAYDMLDEKMSMIEKIIDDYDIVLSALGHASTALGKRLFKQRIATQFIDIGSVIDAIAGANTRGWIRQNWEYVTRTREVLIHESE